MSILYINTLHGHITHLGQHTQGLTLTFPSKESKGPKTSEIKESKQKVRSPSELQQNGRSRFDADEKSVNFEMSDCFKNHYQDV